MTPDDTVLEIGTGSGFLTGLLAFTADRVYSVERIRELSVRARTALDQLRIKNVALMVGDGTIGWRKYAHSTSSLFQPRHRPCRRRSSTSWRRGGRLLIPVGTREPPGIGAGPPGGW